MKLLPLSIPHSQRTVLILFLMTLHPSFYWKPWSAWLVRPRNISKNYGKASLEFILYGNADGWIYHRPIVFEHLSALLSASAQYSILLIERAVVGLLRLCLILAQKVSSSSDPVQAMIWLYTLALITWPDLRFIRHSVWSPTNCCWICRRASHFWSSFNCSEASWYH